MSEHRQQHRQHHHEQEGRTGPLFYCFAAVLLGGILFLGMPVAQAQLQDRRYGDIFLILTGVLGLAGGLTWGGISKVRPESRRWEDRLLLAMAICLPVYALLQWVPLPLGLIAILSPARAELARSLEPVLGPQGFASLSVNPAVTFRHFLLVCGYAVTMFAAREFAVRARRKIWIVAAPVLVGGALETALALLQFSSGGDNPVKGTFAIRNHLAGFLEMAMPLALGFGVAALASARNREDGGRTNWLRIAGGLALAVLSFIAGLATLSRGGFGGIVGSLLVVAAFAVGRGMPVLRRVLVSGGLFVLVVGLIFYATPASLIERLAQHDSEGRTAIWGEGVHVVEEYPVFGAGLGGFESAFLKFKKAEGQFVVDYAHNDYLQGLAELGGIGFGMVALFLGAVVVRSGRMALGSSSPASQDDSPEGAPIGSAETRWAALGCLGSISAILIHSGVDFNLYVPANAATLAWICGMAAGVTPSMRRRRRTVEVPVDLMERPSPIPTERRG